LLDHVGRRDIAAPCCLLEWVQVDCNQVDRRDAMVGECVHVLA
jgi:hypothetical protein